MTINDRLKEAHKASLLLGEMTIDFINIIIEMIHDKYSHIDLATRCKLAMGRQDLEQAALVNICKNWKHFDYKKSDDPYMFFMTSISGSFVDLITKEQKERYIHENFS